jgi:hypothetical protein
MMSLVSQERGEVSVKERSSWGSSTARSVKSNGGAFTATWMTWCSVAALRTRFIDDEHLAKGF